MYQTALKTTRARPDRPRDHARRVRRVGDRRRRLGVRLGPAGRRASRSPRSTTRSSTGSTGSTPPPPTASATRSEIVGRALEGLADGRTCSPSASLLEGPDRTVVHSLKRDSILREADASLARLGRRRDRPLPDPLADPGRGHRGGLGGARRAQGARAWCATSASPTSTSSSCGGSSRSLRSRRCSRSTR